VKNCIAIRFTHIRNHYFRPFLFLIQNMNGIGNELFMIRPFSIKVKSQNFVKFVRTTGYFAQRKSSNNIRENWNLKNRIKCNIFYLQMLATSRHLFLYLLPLTMVYF